MICYGCSTCRISLKLLNSLETLNFVILESELFKAVQFQIMIDYYSNFSLKYPKEYLFLMNHKYLI